MIADPTEPPCRAEGSACASPRNARVPGPPTLLLLALGAMVALHVFAPVASLVAGAWRLLALAPVAAGVALNLSADRAFQRAGTTVKPGLPSTALVTGGVFARTRNPMYLGLILLLAGVWCAVGSVTPGIGVLAFALVVDRWFVQPEEEKLERTFGRVYDDYRARVRRWL